MWRWNVSLFQWSRLVYGTGYFNQKQKCGIKCFKQGTKVSHLLNLLTCLLLYSSSVPSPARACWSLSHWIIKLLSPVNTPPQPTPFWVQQGVKRNSLHSIIDLVYPPCLNSVPQHDNVRPQNILCVGFLLKLNGMLISWLLHVWPAGWFRFILLRSGTCKWALDVVWLRAESGTVFWWHFKCVCSSMKMCLLIHASDLFTRGYWSYLLWAAGWTHCLMSQRVGEYAVCTCDYAVYMKGCRQGCRDGAYLDCGWKECPLWGTKWFTMSPLHLFI